MATDYSVKDNNGDTIIPANDGDYFTIKMDEDYRSGEVFIMTCDSGGNPVTATGGTFTVSCSVLDDQYHPPSNGNGVILAERCGADAAYNPPRFDGYAITTKVTASGITGATHFKAIHVRGDNQ